MPRRHSAAIVTNDEPEGDPENDFLTWCIEYEMEYLDSTVSGNQVKTRNQHSEE
jgi:hypothetical protein